jgi:hypothetical protein
MSVYTDITGNHNPTIDRAWNNPWGRLLTMAMIAGAIYVWFKSPPVIKLWFFLITFAIPIPALWLFNVSPLLTLALGFVWLYVVIAGVVWMGREDKRLRALNEQAIAEEEYLNAMAQRAAHVADRQAGAQETGQAVVDAMRQAYRETGQRPPQEPTGPSQRTSASQESPMGSTSPTLWVPTYSGPARPVQRREITMGGTVVRDHRRIDPDTL